MAPKDLKLSPYSRYPPLRVPLFQKSILFFLRKVARKKIWFGVYQCQLSKSIQFLKKNRVLESRYRSFDFLFLGTLSATFSEPCGAMFVIPSKKSPKILIFFWSQNVKMRVLQKPFFLLLPENSDFVKPQCSSPKCHCEPALLFTKLPSRYICSKLCQKISKT